MPATVTHTVSLARHPASRGTAVRDIAVRAGREPDGRLALTYVIEGDAAQLDLPAREAPRFVEGLWHHTCCECFVRLDDAPGYHEFNFSPSGAWAAYAFARYREGVPLADAAFAPQIAARAAPGRIELNASVALDRLSAGHARGRLALSLSAVTEDRGGALAYWALAHAPGDPDFHLANAFALVLE